MMMKSVEYQRGYDAGYKQALLDALRERSEVATALSGRKLSRPQGALTHKFCTPFGAVD